MRRLRSPPHPSRTQYLEENQIIIWNGIYLLLQMGYSKKQTKEKGEEKAKKEKKKRRHWIYGFIILSLTFIKNILIILGEWEI